VVDTFSLRVLRPFDWPQIASAFGFLLIPLFLNRKKLSRSKQAFLIGMIPCLIVTLYFGVWAETRIFDEWVIPVAVLLTCEVTAYCSSKAVKSGFDSASTA
jgi:hypothetical protein